MKRADAGGNGGALRRAWMAMLAAAMLSAAILASAAPAGAAAQNDPGDDARLALATIAAELAAQIDGAPKLAIAPFKDEALPLAPAIGREFNDHLTAELLAVPDKAYRVMSRDSLKAVIDDIFATDIAADGDVIAALLESAQVDILIVGRIERIGGDILTLSYEATDRNGATVAQAAPRRIPWRRAYGRDLTAHTLDVAVADAVRTLSLGAPDLQLLRLGGIRYEASGRLTDFSRYLADSLAVAFKAAHVSAVSDRKLRVEGIELTPAQLNALNGVAAPERNLRDENLGAEAGSYTLVGSYWPQGEIVEIRLSLTAAGGGSTGWQGAVFEADIGRVALRPIGDFGAWRQRDGQGPIRFTLTTDRGRDPVYRVGEKMNLIVQADRDIRLRCYYLQQDGQVYQIFPNPYRRDDAIAGGRPHTIPGANFPFELDILPPAGKELVKCFALGGDISGRLPAEFEQEEFRPLPPNMKYDLPRLFRALEGIAMTERSTVINVVE